jgi:hypothetical protein
MQISVERVVGHEKPIVGDLACQELSLNPLEHKGTSEHMTHVRVLSDVVDPVDLVLRDTEAEELGLRTRMLPDFAAELRVQVVVRRFCGCDLQSPLIREVTSRFHVSAFQLVSVARRGGRRGNGRRQVGRCAAGPVLRR